MIVFLTLCYCGVLWLLIKSGIIKLNLWWKLSPLVWMLLLLIVLFIPMQWGAPAGPVNVYQTVVEIVPNVSGEVIDVPVEGAAPIAEGDVLFQIDPVPYRAVVDELTAQLEDTKQDVEQLKAAAEAAQATVAKTEADIDLRKTDQVAAEASVEAAKAQVREYQGKKQQVQANIADLEIQIDAAEREFDRVSKLAAQNVVSQTEKDVTELQLTGLRRQLSVAEVEYRVADDTIARGQSNLAVAAANSKAADLALKQLVETELPRVKAKAREAQIAANSMIDGEHTAIATVRAQLEKAQFDLEQTTVRAPSDGVVVGMTLRKGQRVAAFPMRSWMSFVPSEQSTLAAGIPQFALRHIQPGQECEVTLKLHPGRTVSATVDKIIYASEQGQLQPSGILTTAPGVDQQAVPFTVRLKLDDPKISLDPHKLPGGTVGTVAIYTDKCKATHVIRKVMIRMEAWLNYIMPN